MSDYTITGTPLPREVAKLWQKYEGKRGTWYVPEISNAGDEIHVDTNDDSPNKPFRGYGGATLHFHLVDGTIAEAKGPWHSNSDALFKDTGIDLRDKHLTFVVISEGVEYNSMRPTMTGVIYKDEEPTLGEFDRGNYIAQKLANELGITVQLYKLSAGGSCRMQVKPIKEEEDART